MFTAGRILGRRASRAARRASTFITDWETTDSVERRKFRCYVPFVWQSVLATVAGFVVMATGLSLCIVGYYSGHQSQPKSEVQEGNNNTESSGVGYFAAAGAVVGMASADSMTSHRSSLLILMYIGPIVMSVGCFALIFAFVVFCEARDHAIAYYIRTKLYSSMTCGPRHSRLPFSHSVIDHLLIVTKRRAERRAARQSSLSAIVVGSSPTEDVAPVVPPVDDDKVKIDCQPTLLPESLGTDRATDWLLSNGMLHTTSLTSTSLDQSIPAGVQIIHMNIEQSIVNRCSQLSFRNEATHIESSGDPISAVPRDQPEPSSVHRKHLDIVGDRSLLRSNGMLQEQQSPEHVDRIPAGMSDELMDSIDDELQAQNVDWETVEVTPLISGNGHDSDTAPDSVELERGSTIAEQSQVASSKSLSSAPTPSSSTSTLFDASIFSDDDDDKITTTTKEVMEEAADDAVVQGASSAQPEDSPTESPKPSSAVSPSELGDRSIATSEGNDDDDGGKRQTRPCRQPSAENNGTSSSTSCPEAAKTGDAWKRDHQETARRTHSWIHCPPPLPPPPTTPSAPGRSPRRH